MRLTFISPVTAPWLASPTSFAYLPSTPVA